MDIEMEFPLPSPSKTLQERFNRLSSSSSMSKIPVLIDRNVSFPIPQIEDSQLGPNTKKTLIPRIISSPGVLLPQNSESNQYLATYSNRPSPVLNTPRPQKTKDITNSPSTLTKLSSGLNLLTLSTPLPKRHVSLKFTSNVDDESPSALGKRKPVRNLTSYETSSISSPHIVPNFGNSTRLHRIRSERLQNSIPESPSKPPQQAQAQSRIIRDQPFRRVNSSDIESNPFLRLSASTTNSSASTSRHIKQTQSRSLSHSHSHSSFKPNGTPASTNNHSIRTSDSTTRSRATSYSVRPSATPATPISHPLPQSKLGIINSTTGLNSPAQMIAAPPIIRTTRSSRLKQQTTTTTTTTTTTSVSSQDPMSPLVIPKKRPLTKSISIGGGSSSASSVGLANYLSSPRLKRVASSTSRPSPQQSLRTTSRPLLKPTRPPKLSTSQELFLALCKYNKTSKIVNTWGSIESFATQPIQTSIDILNRTNNLTSFERAEISKHHEIYYIGANTGFNSSIIDSSQNFGYDDKNHNLKISLNDHINYRFQVIANLGCGMFGNVIKCKDHKQSRIVSLKVMKNDINWQLQSLNEIKILRSLTGHPNILSYIDHFNFRSHICVVTEMLAVNLIEALEATKFQGFEMNVIKHWSKQLLSGLHFMHGQGIIHCDLKPENIMLISPDSFDLKIIDFGSSAFKDELTYPYIQSRFYRAPEVLLGARYTTQIDIWSFGCVIYEMYKGRPLFPAKDELGLYKMFVKLLGHPSPRAVSSYRNEVIEKGSICAPSSCKTERFIDKKAILFTCFDRLGTYNGIPLEPFRREPLSRKLGIDDGKFMNFLQNILVWNQAERRNAQQLLHHEFLNLD